MTMMTLGRRQRDVEIIRNEKVRLSQVPLNLRC